MATQEIVVRSLPHNLDAERAVIGAVFIAPVAFHRVASIISVDDFFLPDHRNIWDALLELTRRRLPLDVLAVADELKTGGLLARLEGGAAYLNDCANATPTAENVVHYARLVREKAGLRRMIAVCAHVQSSAYGDPGEYDDFLRESLHMMSRIAIRDEGSASESLLDIHSSVLGRLERAQRGEVPDFIPTGIAKLDRLLRGGMMPEELIVPCGLTSMGKSSLGFQIAFRGAEERGIPALIFSLEMSREQAFIKGAASLSRLPTNMFKPPLPGEHVDWKRINPAADRVAKLNHLVRIEDRRSIGEIVAIATAWRADHPGRAFILVDHLQKVKGVRGKNSNRQEEVWGVASELKGLAKDLKLPLMSPAQLDNDPAKDNRAPRIGDIRDSKAIEHEADIVIGIHRERMPKLGPDGEPNYNGPCELIVLKNRNGAVGKKTVMWMGEHQGFEDMVFEEEHDHE